MNGGKREKENELAWWIPNLDPYEERHWERNKLLREANAVKLFSVKLCEECNRVYDEPRNINSGTRTHTGYYLKDFPSYGLERITCKNCRKE